MDDIKMVPEFESAPAIEAIEPIEAFKSISQWENQFRTMPKELNGYYKIIVSHPYHGVEIFWLSLNQWQEYLKSLVAPYWTNGYTMMMQPCD